MTRGKSASQSQNRAVSITSIERFRTEVRFTRSFLQLLSAVVAGGKPEKSARCGFCAPVSLQIAGVQRGAATLLHAAGERISARTLQRSHRGTIDG
jgi:hypothetical protein